MNIKVILAGALVGAVSGIGAAMKTDFDAFKAHPDVNFNWQLAVGRWIQGAVYGGLAGAGFGGKLSSLAGA